MKDGPVRIAVKAVARSVFEAELALRRLWLRARGERRWVLGGDCQGCARCCEAPALRVPRVLVALPAARTVLLAWQRQVNGFALESEAEEGRLLVFECTHFDRETRRCDSYASRPAICRDYPRALLEQPWPDLFEGCGYRAVDTKGARLARALERTGLSERELADLKRKLRVE